MFTGSGRKSSSRSLFEYFSFTQNYTHTPVTRSGNVKSRFHQFVISMCPVVYTIIVIGGYWQLPAVCARSFHTPGVYTFYNNYNNYYTIEAGSSVIKYGISKFRIHRKIIIFFLCSLFIFIALRSDGPSSAIPQNVHISHCL